MDPNACLQRILEAALEEEPDELEHAAHDLAEWLRGGGFAPTVERHLLYVHATYGIDVLRRACHDEGEGRAW